MLVKGDPWKQWNDRRVIVLRMYGTWMTDLVRIVWTFWIKLCIRFSNAIHTLATLFIFVVSVAFYWTMQGLAISELKGLLYTYNTITLWMSFIGLPSQWRFVVLSHWGRDKMAAILQTTFSNEFSSVKIFVFWFKFYWNVGTNEPTLNPVLAWCRTGDKPLTEPMVL